MVLVRLIHIQTKEKLSKLTSQTFLIALIMRYSNFRDSFVPFFCPQVRKRSNQPRGDEGSGSKSVKTDARVSRL